MTDTTPEIKTVEIKTLTDFKHDIYAFEKDKNYSVPEALGLYFIANGWATDKDGNTTAALPELTADHVLEIQDGGSKTPTQGANVKG